MKSGFLLSQGQQEEQQKGGWATKPSMGPLRDTRSNRVKFLWGAGIHNDDNFVTEAQRLVRQERHDRDRIRHNHEPKRRNVVKDDVVMDDCEEGVQDEVVKVVEEAGCVSVADKQKEQECNIATSADAIATSTDVTATSTDATATGPDASATSTDDIATGPDATVTSSDVTALAATTITTTAETMTSPTPTKKKKRKKKKAFVESTPNAMEICQVEVEEGEVEEEQPSPSTTTKTNPYANMPTLPHKTSGVPKNALGAYYSQRYKMNLPNDQFSIRNDGGPPHLLKWTCQFTCPITKEVFTSARYGSPQNYNVDDDGVVWYKQKKLAEHAAAGRALDCLMYRNFLKDSSSWRICVEEPYEVDEAQRQKLGLPKKTDLEDPLVDNPMKHQAEAVVAMEEDKKDYSYREIYRMSRLGSVPNLGL